MKKLIVLIFAWLSVNMMGNATEDVIFYGYRNFQSELPYDYIAGPITFQLSSPTDVTLLQNQTALGRVYAGEYLNYKWYAVTTRSGTQSQPENLVEINMETGERKIIAPASLQLYDMAYDYSTNTMYGILSTGAALGKIDLNSGRVEKIADLPENVYAVAIACDLNGQMYMVAIDDNFYKINKEDATVELIGELKVDAAYTQTMAFDYHTNTLYWFNAGDTNFYTIDITTGIATFISELGENGDNLNSLFVPYTHIHSEAPERVINRKAQPNLEGRLEVLLTWDNPQTTGNRTTLTGEFVCEIYREGVKIGEVTNNQAGGSAQYLDQNIPKAGQYFYRIVPKNLYGIGGIEDEDVMVYVGEDIPGPVVDFNVKSGNNTGVLNWKAPTNGGTNGYYDVTSVTGYKIFRSGVTDPIASLGANETTYEDKTVPSWGKYTYSMYAVNSTGEGVTSTSGEVLIKPSEWIIMTNGTFEVESGTFYDTGGPGRNYSNNERITMTLIPAVSNTVFDVSFTQFKTDPYDELSIYDGPDTESPLIGKFGGTAFPEALEQFYSSGPLTFYFYSDVMDNMEGWTAKIASHQLKNKDLSIGVLSDPGIPILKEKVELTVTVKNMGIEEVSGTSYKVELLDREDKVISSVNGETITSMETKTIVIPYTPSQIGNSIIKAFIAYESDEDLSNNYSNERLVNVQPLEAEWVTIKGEEKMNTGVMPIAFFFPDSYSQTMYLSSMIDKKNGFIKALSYPVTSKNNFRDFNVKVWMGETDKEDISEGNILVSQMQLVYDGNSTLEATGDREGEWYIYLADSYEYKGGNLVISVQKYGLDHPSDYEVQFQLTNVDELVHSWFNTGYGGRLDPDQLMDEYSSNKSYPHTNLLFLQKKEDAIGINESYKLSVYPNPFENQIYIEGVEEGCKAIIMDISGKTLIKIDNCSSPIDVSSLTSGIYLLQVTTNDGEIVTLKIVKK